MWGTVWQEGCQASAPATGAIGRTYRGAGRPSGRRRQHAPGARCRRRPRSQRGPRRGAAAGQLAPVPVPLCGGRAAAPPPPRPPALDKAPEAQEGLLGRVDRAEQPRGAPLPLHPPRLPPRLLHVLLGLPPVEGQEVPPPVLVHVHLPAALGPLGRPRQLVVLQGLGVPLGVAPVQGELTDGRGERGGRGRHEDETFK